ncbi:MAG: hypothetical protein AB3N16_00545 [Flavobacteriaceae bacterium]
MKIRFLLFLTCMALGTYTGLTQCSKYYPFKDGATLQYTLFDKKGKGDGQIDYTIHKTSDNGATLKTSLTDKKGRHVFTSDYGITCTGNGISIDFQSLVPSHMVSQYEEMGVDMNIDGTDIELPNELRVGQELNDAHVNVTINMAGMKMKKSVTTTGRKGEKKETISNPAGNFECYVISETNHTETMNMGQAMTNRIWLSEGIGIIKQESYKKNGALLSRMELSSLSL